ncbi:MAG TPA: hypothetical protein VG710_00485 [Opitutus sp.]|nr:hypothetical protein [Opitutus sp.]
MHETGSANHESDKGVSRPHGWRMGVNRITDEARTVVVERARKQLADQQAKRAELERLLQALG